LRLTVHREVPEDDRLASQWNALVGQMECPEVFYTYEWALAVSRAYRESVRPLLMLGFEEGTLLGVAALAQNPPHTEVTFIAGTTADYCDFVSEPGHRQEFLQLVFDELRRLDLRLLVLANMPADSATCRVLRIACSTSHYSLFSRPAFRCAQVDLSSPEQKKLTKQSVHGKQMLRRHLKNMQKLGPVTVRHLRLAPDVIRSLPAFERTHVARFSATGRTSNLTKVERRAFLFELANLLSEPGWINLSTLNIGDTTVAWNYGFQFAGTWFWYQPTFDGDYRRYYPGLCLLGKIVEEACSSSGVTRVDLGLGSERYKEGFATGSLETLHLTFNASRARHVREIVRYRAASAIKSSPPLEQCVRRLLGRAAIGDV